MDTFLDPRRSSSTDATAATHAAIGIPPSYTSASTATTPQIEPKSRNSPAIQRDYFCSSSGALSANKPDDANDPGRSAYSAGVTPVGSPMAQSQLQQQQRQEKARNKVRRSRTIHTISDAIQHHKMRARASAGELAGLGRVRSASSMNTIGGGAGGKPGTKVSLRENEKKSVSNSEPGCNCSSFGRHAAEQKLINYLSLLQAGNSVSSTSASKRPSFTWIQYQSPRKGFLTILVVVGSFFLQWIPTLVGAIYEVIGWDHLVQEWVKSVKFW